MHPGSGDTYESIAQGYEDTVDKEMAIKNYKNAVELNPGKRYAAYSNKEPEGKTNQ